MSDRRVLSAAALLFGIGLLFFIGSCGSNSSTSSSGSPGQGSFTAKGSVLTYHNDNLRTGQNLLETVLTPQSVSSTKFGKLFSYAVDGAIYAQPLFVKGLQTSSMSARNVIYVVTEHNSVYAFDADHSAPHTLWHVSLSGSGASSVPCADEPEACDFFGTEIGITSTPVIDPSSSTLYVCAFTKESGSYVYRLHALDLATGSEKFGGPVMIQGSVTGTEGGSKQTTVSFNPHQHIQRSALLLANGTLYLAFASFSDVLPFHGWLFGYDAQTLQPQGVLNLTPDGIAGGVWQSGNGAAADSAGNVYLITGNGTFDADSGGRNFGDSFVRVKPGTASLSVADFFTPFNQGVLNIDDADLGAGGPLLLPDQAGAHPHLMLAGGKEGTLYLVDRDNMGHFHSSDNSQIVQSLVKIVGPIFCSPAFWENKVYIAGMKDSLKVFNLSDGVLSTAPASQSTTIFGFPGATPAISANDSHDGIVWAVENASFSSQLPAVLHAYDAGDLSHELYNSHQAGASLPIGVGFAVPTVASGKVYVGTLSELAVFGLSSN